MDRPVLSILLFFAPKFQELITCHRLYLARQTIPEFFHECTNSAVIRLLVAPSQMVFLSKLSTLLVMVGFYVRRGLAAFGHSQWPLDGTPIVPGEWRIKNL